MALDAVCLEESERGGFEVSLILKEVIRERYENGMGRPAREGDSPVS